jgi:hypothetical protein
MSYLRLERSAFITSRQRTYRDFGIGREGQRTEVEVNLYALLRVVFDVAKQHDFIEASPVRPKIHRPISHKKEKPTLTAEQTWRVLTAVGPEHRLIFIMAALTVIVPVNCWRCPGRT